MVASTFEETSQRGLGRGRRVGVIVLGMILAGVACGVIGLGFVQGSWWYSYGTDCALDRESRARVEAILDEVDTGGAAPEAVPWLNAALDPDAHPTDTRAHLMAAREALKAADDPKLAKVVKELQVIIRAIRQCPVKDTVTSYHVSTPEWPW
jgi:hypothetical protein